jgi:hypothetical protein
MLPISTGKLLNMADFKLNQKKLKIDLTAVLHSIFALGANFKIQKQTSTENNGHKYAQRN